MNNWLKPYIENLQNIFFYVYDKKKIIKETKNFNDYFNKQFDRKTVKLFVLQPVKL